MDKHDLDDEAIGTLLDRKVKESVGWYNSKLSIEREKVLRYYHGEYPKRTSPGSASYVSNEVYDAVEAMKAQLLETFAVGQHLVRFDPNQPDDIGDAENATLYTHYIVHSQNPGYKIFQDVIHDGLIARVGVVKVYWDEDYELSDEEFEELDEPSVQAMGMLDEVESLDAEQDDETGLYKGKLTRKINKSQVRIEVVNPEEFSVESQARELTDNTFCCHRTIKRLSDLKKAGFDISKVEEWNAEDDISLQQHPEMLARFNAIDDGINKTDDSVQDEQRWVVVTEAYIQLELSDDDHPKLYKVTRVGHYNLDIEEVECLPFVCFVPLPESHIFYGNNFASKVIPSQNVITVLTRAIVDHTTHTTNPRYQVVKGGVVNPKELLDNRLGGIVNVTRPDAVTPLIQAPLNPYVLKALELVKAQTEEMTGISMLSQGLNKEAISNQNSADLIDQMVTLSQTRQKIIARNFAIGFLIPLYIKAYTVALRNDNRKRMVEVCGEWKEIDPTSWIERTSMTVSLHVGYGENEREAMKLVQWGSTLMQDPELSHMVTPENKYRMAGDAAKLGGINNWTDYLTAPDKVGPPPPPPQMVAEMEIRQKEVEAKLMSAQASMEKVNVSAEMERMKFELDVMKTKFQQMLDEREADRHDADVQNRIQVSQVETAILATNAANAANEEDPMANQTRTIVSP
jgi:hypothetical protein